jgi:hypothetical protein
VSVAWRAVDDPAATARTSLHPENETRLLSLLVTDTPGQTAAVMGSLTAAAAGDDVQDPPDLGHWQACRSGSLPPASPG